MMMTTTILLYFYVIQEEDPDEWVLIHTSLYLRNFLVVLLLSALLNFILFLDYNLDTKKASNDPSAWIIIMVHKIELHQGHSLKHLADKGFHRYEQLDILYLR